MQLNKVQEQFKDLMLDHPKALNHPPKDFAQNFASGRIPLPDRLKVYRNNIVGSLTDVMIASFPTIDKLVGREFMEGMARSFILENPPNTGCLNTFGQGFAEFIETFEPAKSLPYLPDIARLEIALNNAYHAKDDQALTPKELAAISPENLSDLNLQLRASADLIISQFPIDQIHEYCKSDTHNAPAPNLNEGPVHLMIYRPVLDSKVIILDEASFSFLQNLQDNKALGGALESVMADHPAFDIQKFLHAHIQFETFQTLRTN